MIAGRTFLRIAWRECWRHPGRSALVVALVAFPVAVAAAALTARATIVPTPEEEHRLDYGTADLQVACRCPSPADPGALTSRAGQVEASLRDRLPPDAALLPVSGDVGLEVVAGDRAARRVEILSTDPHHPMHASRFRLDAGRLPTSADQITISPSLADEIDVGIGDVIELYPGGDEVEVVGLARERSGLRRPLAIILPGRVPTTTWWVDLPAAQRATDVAAGLADLADATPVERLLEPAQRTIDKAGEISAAYLERPVMRAATVSGAVRPWWRRCSPSPPPSASSPSSAPTRPRVVRSKTTQSGRSPSRSCRPIRWGSSR
ncbi:MAG TPA: hypothetical protein VFZ68_17680 [Acidimicrobiales bacterium]